MKYFIDPVTQLVSWLWWLKTGSDSCFWGARGIMRKGETLDRGVSLIRKQQGNMSIPTDSAAVQAAVEVLASTGFYVIGYLSIYNLIFSNLVNCLLVPPNYKVPNHMLLSVVWPTSFMVISDVELEFATSLLHFFTFLQRNGTMTR